VFHVILFEPEIPPNTGNIIRLCANTGCTLHLIEPLGFALDEPRLRRAGLDYAEMAAVHTYASLAACLDHLSGVRLYAIETGQRHSYAAAHFQPGDALLFGPETRGIPADFLERLPAEQKLGIPMRAGNRSLNLANSVALVVYEAWRQQQFAGALGPEPADLPRSG
jgi:tRNA (cytidine/uridine-2'-O-)-methyltransferase